ncbi:DUF4192 domain-containing protein [Hoyosella sp. G463]|uniref:DUF4192 domain-containing protein n=1 Tax=Lolliginicoccus lacisalsi TaxID=2742202 RepID=A0A927PL16_9ACTN|nr:DUF4192 domain-containing protein [Lolliginicoccus lacisalsi]MBD8505384.1 DUF4192 domain-containing protein [Lolliginicoccus lacisalsi]
MTNAPNPATPRITLGDPGELIAALPAMLGFYPEDSIIGIAMGGPRATEMRGFVRADIPYLEDLDEEWNQDEPGIASGPPDPALRASLPGQSFDWFAVAGLSQSLAVFALNNGIDHLVLVAVDSRNPEENREDLIHALADHVIDSGVTIASAYHCARIAAGDVWHAVSAAPVDNSAAGDADAGFSGLIADPRGSEAAAHRVLDGRAIHEHRRDIVDGLTSPDDARIAAIAAEPTPPSKSRSRESARTTPPRRATDADRLRAVLAAVADVQSGTELSNAEIAALGQHLRRLVVRDCLFTLALTDEADAAHSLWMLLTQLLSGPARAEAACLLAYSAYVAGDGACSGSAIDIALEIEPEHRMSVMLDQSLRIGLPPRQIMEIAYVGWDLAAALGVSLPPLASRPDL